MPVTPAGSKSALMGLIRHALGSKAGVGAAAAGLGAAAGGIAGYGTSAKHDFTMSGLTTPYGRMIIAGQKADMEALKDAIQSKDPDAFREAAKKIVVVGGAGGGENPFEKRAVFGPGGRRTAPTIIYKAAAINPLKPPKPIQTKFDFGAPKAPKIGINAKSIPHTNLKGPQFSWKPGVEAMQAGIHPWGNLPKPGVGTPNILIPQIAEGTKKFIGQKFQAGVAKAREVGTRISDAASRWKFNAGQALRNTKYRIQDWYRFSAKPGMQNLADTAARFRDAAYRTAQTGYQKARWWASDAARRAWQRTTTSARQFGSWVRGTAWPKTVQGAKAVGRGAQAAGRGIGAAARGTARAGRAIGSVMGKIRNAAGKSYRWLRYGSTAPMKELVEQGMVYAAQGPSAFMFPESKRKVKGTIKAFRNKARQANYDFFRSNYQFDRSTAKQMAEIAAEAEMDTLRKMNRGIVEEAITGGGGGKKGPGGTGAATQEVAALDERLMKQLPGAGGTTVAGKSLSDIRKAVPKHLADEYQLAAETFRDATTSARATADSLLRNVAPNLPKDKAAGIISTVDKQLETIYKLRHEKELAALNVLGEDAIKRLGPDKAHNFFDQLVKLKASDPSHNVQTLLKQNPDFADVVSALGPDVKKVESAAKDVAQQYARARQSIVKQVTAAGIPTNGRTTVVDSLVKHLDDAGTAAGMAAKTDVKALHGVLTGATEAAAKAKMDEITKMLASIGAEGGETFRTVEDAMKAYRTGFAKVVSEHGDEALQAIKSGKAGALKELLSKGGQEAAEHGAGFVGELMKHKGALMAGGALLGGLALLKSLFGQHQAAATPPQYMRAPAGAYGPF